MNSYRIINTGDPENDTDVITKGWFDQYVDDAAGASAIAVAAADRAQNSAQSAEIAAAQAAIAAGQIGDNVRLSRDWAIKMDGPVEDGDYSSKYNAHLILDDTGFQTVAADLQDADSAIKECADNIEAIQVAPDYAEEARVWATGEDAEVDEYEEGEHSSRGYADLAMAIANTPEDVPIDVGGLLALDVIRGERGEGVPEMYGQSGKWLTTDGHDGVWSDISYTVLTDKPVNVSTWTNDADYQSGTQVSTAISNLLAAVYPVGSIYITTSNTCPLSSLISDSTWTLVSSGKVLQGADNDHAAGTSISAGLPNITGGLTNVSGKNAGRSVTGAFSSNNYVTGISMGGGANYKANGDVGFDASISNSIYGSSDTVQPPAYCVNIFERTA